MLCGLFSITSLLIMKLCWPIRKTVSPLPFKGAFIFNSVLPPSKCHSTLALQVRANLLWENPAFPQTTSSSLLLRTRGGTSHPPAYRDPHGSQSLFCSQIILINILLEYFYVSGISNCCANYISEGFLYEELSNVWATSDMFWTITKKVMSKEAVRNY